MKQTGERCAASGWVEQDSKTLMVEGSLRADKSSEHLAERLALQGHSVTEGDRTSGGTVEPAGSEMALIPGGHFGMGDQQGHVEAAHPSDNMPGRKVRSVSAHLGKYAITVQQYVAFLNSAVAQGTIEVRSGLVCSQDSEIYCATSQADECSRIEWDGSTFSVLSDRGYFPADECLLVRCGCLWQLAERTRGSRPML